MSRKLGIQYPGAIYHVMNRGDRREAIFQDDEDRLGWPEDELRRRAKGYCGKVRMARRLRQETTLSLKWIAQRLQIGSWSYVSNLLNERPQCPGAQEMLTLCQ